MDGANTFTAVAQDTYGRRDTNTVSPVMHALIGLEYDGNGNMTYDGNSLNFE